MCGSRVYGIAARTEGDARLDDVEEARRDDLLRAVDVPDQLERHLHDEFRLYVLEVPHVPKEALVAAQRHLGLQHRAHLRHQPLAPTRVM
eukprot:7080671-Prymnesium_polylepis.1